MTIYKGYECKKNMIDGKYYGCLYNDLYLEERIVTDTAKELMATIDKKVK